MGVDRIGEKRAVAVIDQMHRRAALGEAGGAAGALAADLVAVGRIEIGQRDLAGEMRRDGTDLGRDLRRHLGVGELHDLLAAGDALLQDLGVVERCPDLAARRSEAVLAGHVHGGPSSIFSFEARTLARAPGRFKLPGRAPLSLGGLAPRRHDRAMLPLGYTLPWTLPFIGLVLTIAIAPHVSALAWERHYGKAALAWSLAFVVPDLVRSAAATDAELVDTALHVCLPFVLLLGTLYIIAGGLRITGAPRGTPAVNTAVLGLGTVMAGLIGTAGASLLMLRPLIRANRHRREAAHVFVFFILLVANVGGALTPIGNPPLFLGYLKGVPIF